MPLVGGIGSAEILLLVLLAILLFGSRRLPSLGRSAGKGLREFKDHVTDYKEPIQEVKELVAVDEVKDLAALTSPRKALSKMLTDEPGDAETPASAAPRDEA